MNVLLVHPLYSALGSWERGVVRSFQHLGDRTSSIDYRLVLGSKRLAEAARRARLHGPLLLGEIRRRLRRFQPDLIFVSKGEMLGERILLELRKACVPLVNWIGDGPWMLEFIRRAAPLYDYFFTFDSATVRRLEAEGINSGRYLPFGFDSLLESSFEPVDHDYYRSDVCFIGSPTSERMEMLRALDLQRLQLKIWGPADWRGSEHARWYMGRPLVGAEMRHAFASSKVVLNVHYGFGDSRVPPYAGINQRVFETGGVGAFSIVSTQDDMARTFRVELATYDSYEELSERLAHYLGAHEERAAHARAVREAILNRHTLVHRVRELRRIAVGEI